MINTNAYALLCLLSIKPMNGYLMKQWVDKLLIHYWKTSYGQIYPTMEKFMKDGLVTVEDVQNDKRPPSKYYHITERGLEELKEWLAEDTMDFNSKDEALLKYKFSYLLPIDDVIKKAEKSMQHQMDILERYSDDANRMEETTNPTREQLMTYLATKKGIYLNEARVKWTKECVQALKHFKKENTNENK